MYAVVALVGFPAALRNITAAALTISWLVGEIWWMATGDNLPLSTYFMTDVAVVSVIYAKTIVRVGAKTYPSLLEQLRCLIVDLTPYDRWVVAIFLLGAWPLYVLSVHPWWKWYGLWAMVIAQFLIAGAEAIQSLRRDVKMRAASDPQGNGLALAGAYRNYG
jgi:hypothetical protein